MAKRVFRRLPAVLFLAAMGLFAVVASRDVFGQQLAKRLILKDGSYQSAVKWEVKGYRVRYLSAERNEWEELPNSLVDWAATDKYEKERSSGAAPPEVKELDEQAAADRAAAEAATPQVAPGLRLPYEGVFVLDAFQGQPQLVEVQQNGGELNRNTKKNVLRAMIIPIPLSAKQTIELKGPHAQAQAHTTRPVLFINAVQESPETDTKVHADQVGKQKTSRADPNAGGSAQKAEQPEGAEKPEQPLIDAAQRYRLVRVQSKKDTRIVGNISVAIYGKVSQKENFVPAEVEAMQGGWVKITPAADLQPGEYALVEMLSPKEMNLYVWDFGVNPAAPANPSAWTPQASASKTRIVGIPGSASTYGRRGI